MGVLKNIVLSLGSNLGDRRAFLEEARFMIASDIGEIVRSSSMYENVSWGFESGDFLNQVLEVASADTPQVLLQKVESNEKRLGRNTKSYYDSDTGTMIYSDRTIDIDILLYRNESFSGQGLTIPHPGITEREFVLRLLTELFQDEVIPPFTSSFKQLLQHKLKSSSILK